MTKCSWTVEYRIQKCKWKMEIQLPHSPHFLAGFPDKLMYWLPFTAGVCLAQRLGCRQHKHSRPCLAWLKVLDVSDVFWWIVLIVLTIWNDCYLWFLRVRNSKVMLQTRDNPIFSQHCLTGNCVDCVYYKAAAVFFFGVFIILLRWTLHKSSWSQDQVLSLDEFWLQDANVEKQIICVPEI